MGCSVNRTIYNELYDSQIKTDGESGPYVRFNKELYEETSNLYQNKSFIEIILNSFQKFNNNKCLGFRKKKEDDKFEDHYTFFTYRQVYEYAEALSKNIRLLNLANQCEKGEYEFIGIYSRNCVEWAITDVACQLMSITTPTFYSTLGELAFEHICNQTRVATICISPENAANLINYKKKFGLINQIKVLIFDLTQKLDDQIINDLQSSGFNTFFFSKLIVFDSNKNIELKISKPETTLTICYTSGTTGLPKGAELSQKNFASEMCVLPDCGFPIRETTCHLSYLPLAHVMERLCLFLMLANGASVGFISGDVKKFLTDDLKILRPTMFVAVPRVLSTFRQAILQKFSHLEGIGKSMVESGLETKRNNLREKGEITHWWYDTTVFNKVRDQFGGRIEVIITGSAPLTKDLADDIKILLSCPIIEGYGMTECAGACMGSSFRDYSNESVGAVMSTCKVKLIDVPGTNYNSKDKLEEIQSPSGEICVSGPLVFKGYYLNPEETAKVLDKDGWLHTGDVARLLPNSNGFKIIDRVKEIFKLSQGEYIAPSKLESAYSKSKYVAQLCVCGDSTKNNIVAIVIPNKQAVIDFLTTKKRWSETSKFEEFVEDKEVFEELSKEFDKIAIENKFNSLEKINYFCLSLREFNFDNGCLTPTMKIVRRKVAELYKAEIDSLYSKCK
jgi:long-chain acyl-CoA synthetase